LFSLIGVGVGIGIGFYLAIFHAIFTNGKILPSNCALPLDPDSDSDTEKKIKK
jgi:hypothetical protein